MVEDMAKGPAGIGQKVFAFGSIAGSGDGGRRFWHRYELFDHAFSVRTDVVVNRVAGEKDRSDKVSLTTEPLTKTRTCVC